ncbi:MAG: type II toxin-antitoxin system prevent-host-death family antitoxin [Acidobacteria bacterium]|nr:MAG: type II toxin-antitoxin system prevent-host-death family antitoxin [Acidobacteriota bacterium]
MATSVGIRELKNKLSAYVRRSEAGEIIEITAHGRTVARLFPPASAQAPGMGYDALVAAGQIIPPRDPHARIRWPNIHLPPGTAAALIDEDRDER